MMRGMGDDQLRSLSFITIVVANLALICTNLSWSESMFSTFRKPNSAFWWVMGGTIFFLGAVFIIPALRELFRFAPITPGNLVLCMAGGLLSVVWFEVFKIIRGRQNPK